MKKYPSQAPPIRPVEERAAAEGWDAYDDLDFEACGVTRYAIASNLEARADEREAGSEPRYDGEPTAEETRAEAVELRDIADEYVLAARFRAMIRTTR